ncbi:MAG: alpha/beta hydrolase [Anaerolineaceae bacterium]|nr:alpha/beta hydrolase [Anaerolineaceae bacterium]
MTINFQSIRKRFDPDAHYAVALQPSQAYTHHFKRKYLDIPYTPFTKRSLSHTLDIYLPDEGNEPFPVILSIHGGAFMGCDKADMQVLPMLDGVHRGYAVVAVNYRLSWEATFPALVQDVKAAVRWVRGNAKWYHLDPARIAAWGGSAGGYLSTMLGVSEGIPELEDLSLGYPDQPCSVQAVVDWFGPTDFLKMDEQLIANDLPPMKGTEHSSVDSPESLLLGSKITDIPERVRAANPETYIRENAAPFLIQHGIADFTVPYQQSIGLAENLKRVCGEERVVLELFEGFEHGDHRLGSPVNVNRVLDFLDQHLKCA